MLPPLNAPSPRWTTNSQGSVRSTRPARPLARSPPVLRRRPRVPQPRAPDSQKLSAAELGRVFFFFVRAAHQVRLEVAVELRNFVRGTRRVASSAISSAIAPRHSTG